MADKKKEKEAKGESGQTSEIGGAQQSAEPKRLYRSLGDRYIAGVCGGVAEYFDIDPNLVRIIWAIASFVGGIGIIGYIAGWIVMPENPNQEVTARKIGESNHNFGLIIGGILIVIGLALLANQFNFRYFSPGFLGIFSSGALISLVIIGVGLYMILQKNDESLPKVESESQTMTSDATKKLTRSVSDRKIAGVCGGLAKYFNMDPSIVRIVFVLLAVPAFLLMIVAYIVMAIVVPEEDNREVFSNSQQVSR